MIEKSKGSSFKTPAVFQYWKSRNLGMARLEILGHSAKRTSYEIARTFYPSQKLNNKIELTGKKIESLLEGPYKYVIENKRLSKENDAYKRIEGLLDGPYKDAIKNERLLKENSTLIAEKKFFNVMVHDMRSPFHGILGFCDIISENLKNDNFQAVKEHHPILADQCSKAYKLFEELNELRAKNSGKLSIEEFNLYETVGSILDIAAGNAAKKQVRLINSIPKNFIMLADAAIIKTVIRNLVSNAIKFTRPGDNVEICANRDGNPVQISVKDTGAGIKPEILAKLFKNNEKAVSTVGTSGEGGSGFGLTVCKWLVESHQGEIGVESEEGKGSTFTFTVPKKPHLDPQD